MDARPGGDPNALSDKEQCFIEHYMRHFNRARAAREAGYPGDPFSAYQVYHRPVVRKAIQDRFTAMKMETDEVLGRLRDQAEASIEEFLKIEKDPETGEALVTLDLEKAREAGKLHLIKKLATAKRGGRIASIELVDTQGALNSLAKANKIWDDSPKAPENNALDKLLDILGKKVESDK
jgi:hypothetical protein